MHLHRRPFLFFIPALALLGGLHVFFMEFYLYWMYRWLDVPMHLLGGAVVALGYCTVIRDSRNALLWALSIVLLVSIVWEVYEAATGMTFTTSAPIADTALDLVVSVLGGALGYHLVRRDA